MKYINYSKSVRILSIAEKRGTRLIKLNVGAGELSEADALAIVQKGKPTNQAMILAANGIVRFDNPALIAAFDATQKKSDPFLTVEDEPKKPRAKKQVEVDTEEGRPE